MRRPRPARPSVHRQRESTTSCTLIDWQRQLKSQSVTLLVTGYTAVLHHWDSNLNFRHCHQEERKTWSNMIAFEGPFAFASGRNRLANGTRTPSAKEILMRSQFDHLIRDTSDEEGIMEERERKRVSTEQSQKVRQQQPGSMGRACGCGVLFIYGGPE